MSLMGDAMSHAILPGAAIGYLLAGLSLFAMSLGGFAAGLAVALAAGLVARSTVLREDASLAAFYLVSLALGVLIVSVRGSNVDLLHVLFGTVLALDDAALYLVASITTVSLAVLAVIYRPLVLECFDPQFLRSASRLRRTPPGATGNSAERSRLPPRSCSSSLKGETSNGCVTTATTSASRLPSVPFSRRNRSR